MPLSATFPNVISFAASDPTTGAGLQADLLTFSALHCHALTVVTALTVQDSHGVNAVQTVDAAFIKQQAQCLLADFPLAAAKIGMLGNALVANAVADIVCAPAQAKLPLVIDPVLASGRGDLLSDSKTLDVLRQRLLPRADLITPNSLEAAQLAGFTTPLLTEADSDACAQHLITTYGCRHVLITGTHLESTEVINRLYNARGLLHSLSWPRLPHHYHGSGCTLASAIAASLAQGLELTEAVRAGQDYTWRTLAAAYAPGHGQHIPDRLLHLRRT